MKNQNWQPKYEASNPSMVSKTQKTLKKLELPSLDGITGGCHFLPISFFLNRSSDEVQPRPQ